MVCQSIKPNINKICIGDLNKKIKIQYSPSIPSNNPNTNAGTSFKDLKTVWAMVKTRSAFNANSQFVNNTNTGRSITIEFYVRWTSEIDFERELWVEFKSKEYKIEKPENIDEEDKFVRLVALERGTKTINANQR